MLEEKGTGASLTMKLLGSHYEGTRLDILQTPIRKKKNLVSQLYQPEKKKKKVQKILINT